MARGRRGCLRDAALAAAQEGAGGREGAADAEERTAEAQLPLAAELMAACLAAGAGPERAAEAVGGSVGGPLGERLVLAATELRLGAEAASVWAGSRSAPGEWSSPGAWSGRAWPGCRRWRP
ncbi:hypothetical protein [Streptomyces albus]|uniref:hypothetical protein n=1 Tax=Streptomyces albus TaxID=1888 RepID=UPI002A283150|nr:hypothetical protein TPA0909_55430 [Streptomyces albus]